jgi:hypothetical protein
MKRVLTAGLYIRTLLLVAWLLACAVLTSIAGVMPPRPAHAAASQVVWQLSDQSYERNQGLVIVHDIAPPVADFSPTNKTTVQAGLTSLSVRTAPGAKLVLDHQAVSGTYDAHMGRLTYHAARPLAAGLHLVQLVGTDGTLAILQAEFMGLPPRTIQPPSGPAGTVAGQLWVRTSTPNGGYGLLKPAAWKLSGVAGTAVLLDPQGTAGVILSERFLGAPVDALAIAHKMAGSLSRGQHLTTASRFAGNANAAAHAVQVRAARGATLDVLTFVIEQAAMLLVELACTRPSHDQSAKVINVASDRRWDGGTCVPEGASFPAPDSSARPAPASSSLYRRRKETTVVRTVYRKATDLCGDKPEPSAHNRR